MTGRERLTACLNGNKTDRVPVSTYELCGFNSESFENKEPSYARLMNYIRKNTDAVTMWNPSSTEVMLGSSAPLNISVKEEYKNSIRIIEKTILLPKVTLKQINQIEDNIVTVWQTKHPCGTVDEVNALLDVDYVPVKYDYFGYERVKNETGENGIIMASVPDPLCYAAELMSFGDFTIWAMTEEEHFSAVLEKLFFRIMTNLEEMLKKPVELYRICGPEYATEPYLPPRLFAKYVTPYIREMAALIHKHGSKVRAHSHGRLKNSLAEFNKMGVDAIDPVEDTPDGDIALSEVKKALPGVTLFGNIQLKLLERGSKPDIEKYVEYCMGSAKEGGRFVIMPTAAPINVPLSPKTEENYFAFIDTALRMGKY